MPNTPARAIAFDVLLRAETERAYASEILRARLGAKVSARDAALTTEIVMGTLRWQRQLDFIIERFTAKKPRSFDPQVLVALRMGIYQLRNLKKIPARAAVNEAVELVKRARKQSAAPLVNAVLRRAADEARLSVRDLLPKELTEIARLEILYAHPAWMIKRWVSRFGEKRTLELLKADNCAPAVACAVVAPDKRKEILREFETMGLHPEGGKFLSSAILVRGGDISKTRAFQKGWVSIQDEGSQMIPLLLGVQKGDSVLDLCAAPGGKTMALARAAGPLALVIAADRHEHRQRAMRERLRNAGFAPLDCVVLDGTTPLPFPMKFDRILVDAPCSGTGTLARNPEIRWRLKPEDLTELHQRQVNLLRSAMECLVPGGTLLYSTCSLEPEENERAVASALAAHPKFRHASPEIRPEILAPDVSSRGLVDCHGYFRTFPPEQHTDGFFAAALARK